MSSCNHILLPFHTHRLNSRLTLATSPASCVAVCFNYVSLGWRIRSENTAECRLCACYLREEEQYMAVSRDSKCCHVKIHKSSSFFMSLQSASSMLAQWSWIQNQVAKDAFKTQECILLCLCHFNRMYALFTCQVTLFI